MFTSAVADGGLLRDHDLSDSHDSTSSNGAALFTRLQRPLLATVFECVVGITGKINASFHDSDLRSSLLMLNEFS